MSQLQLSAHLAGTRDHDLVAVMVGAHQDRDLQGALGGKLDTLGLRPVARALGVQPTVPVDTMVFDIDPGDVYLLCSDGLPDMVEDDDIHLTIKTFNASLDVVGQQLIEMANDHGGRDNVSVMLAQVIGPFAAKKPLLTRITSLFR